jgi:SAM-dependent methyltransferase
MTVDESFWDFYWETRLQAMVNLGKREAILSGSSLIRRMAAELDHPIRLLELGCGEGQVIGALLDAHSQVCDVRGSVGVDYNAQSLATCRRENRGMLCIEGDFTDEKLLASLGKFDMVLLVNALHEVFSATRSEALGEVDVPFAKQRVEQALGRAGACLAPTGWLVLFDGLEQPGDLGEPVRIRFLDGQSRADFENFANTYQPFHVVYDPTDDPLTIVLPRRDFTRYITKSIFLQKGLWKTERFESYQYFNQSEFVAAFARQGLRIIELRTLTVNEDKWRRRIEVIHPPESFPEEHILILARP